jgi:serine/threonine protein kinase
VTIAPGEIISDRYRIVDQLGEGGMGAVFRAEHVHMKKMVALKVLLGELARHPEVVARFEREAVAAANIEHPNIVNATDFGKLPDGSFFLVMEYVPGRSLRMELGTGMAMDPVRAIRITRGILSAIEAAHAKNIVHRDLKPENVMLVERDEDRDFVKVLDFGIAKVDMVTSEENTEGKKLTRTGAVIGTPEYMAPEQALGQSVDARSDLYSLGVMLYEMLTGKPPFHGPAIVVMRKQVLEAAPPLPEELTSAMPGIAPVLEKLLQKEPQNRYQTANELRAALSAIEGAPVSSPRLPVALESGRISIASLPGPAPNATADTILPGASTTPKAPKTSEAPSRRRHVVIGGGALLGVVSLVAIGFSFSSGEDAKAQPHTRHVVATASGSASTSVAANASASASASPLASADDDDDDKDDDAPASSATATATTHSKAGTASTTKPAQKRPRRRSSGGGGGNIIDDFKKLFK